MNRKAKAKAVEQALCDHQNLIDKPGKKVCVGCGEEFLLAPGHGATAMGAGAATCMSTVLGWNVVAKEAGEVVLKSRVPWHRRIWKLLTFPIRYLLYGDIRL